MSDAATWADSIWRRGIAPDPLLTIDEWADRYRVLPPSSAEPGPWRTDRLPFLREIMREMTPSVATERVVVMKAAQVGATEVLLNFIGYTIAQAPANMLLVMPSLTMIRENTPRRIDPLIEYTPEVQRRVVRSEGKLGGNTKTEKRFVGGLLNMVGANSAAGLRSIPAPFVLLDEVDAYPPSAGDEGDPVALALRAQTTYVARRKAALISTPLTKGFSRIEAAFGESDKRLWHCPCPHCDEHWVIRWENVTWPEGRRELAHLVCPHCGAVIEERDRHAMVAAGAWRSTAPGDGRTAGFHIGGLLSPFRTLAQFAIEHGQVYRDPSRLKTFRNLWLGELWEDDAGAAPDSFAMLDRLDDWGEVLPAGVVALTAGVDVQDDRLEIEIVGWGRDEESWSIAHRVIWGDPAGPDIWQTLDQDLRQTFRHARAVPPLHIRACCIDSGGHHTASVYRFAADRHQRRVWAIKGRGGPGVPLWPRRPSRANKVREKVPVYLVGVDGAKEAIYARLKLVEPGPGYCHFPAGRDPEYFAQLTAERQVTRYVKGRATREWRLAVGARNEALDCRVYATAALQGLVTMGLRLNREAEALEAIPLAAAQNTATAMTAAKPAVIRSKWLE
jgi:phage terminase large subunit GpA-like protein